MFSSLIVKVQLLGEGGVEKGRLLFVVEILSRRARLVLPRHPLGRHGEHGHNVPLERVLLNDPGQALDEPAALDGVSPEEKNIL